MKGFDKETGHLHPMKVIDTSREEECVFKGINTYKNNHGIVLEESQKRQLKCTTSIYKKEDMIFLDCLLPLHDEICKVEAIYFKIQEYPEMLAQKDAHLVGRFRGK